MMNWFSSLYWLGCLAQTVLFILFANVIPLARSIGIDNQFCSQTKVTNIFQLNQTIYFQFMNHFWRWTPNEGKPKQDKHLRYLFYFYLNRLAVNYQSYIYEGFNGFQVTTSFSNQANLVFFSSSMRDYHVVANYDPQANSIRLIAGFHYIETQEADKVDPEFKRFVHTLNDFTSKVFYFDNEQNYLLVGYIRGYNAYKVNFYKDLEKPIDLNYPDEYGHLKGIFKLNETVYFYTEKYLGIFNSKSKKFIVPNTKEISTPLLFLLKMFGCNKKELVEFDVEETNRLSKIFSNIFVVVIVVLLISAISLKLIKRKNKQKKKLNK